MKSIQFFKEALLDAEDIILWYEYQKKGLSYDFELCLEAGISEIQRISTAFQKRYKEVHILFIKRFPFGIHYIINNKSIIIIGIINTSRSPKNWSGRLPL